MAARCSSRHQDTGYAWCVCACSFLILTILGGFMYTSGMFYIMFKNGLDADDSVLTLITSINIGTMFLLSPLVGLMSQRYSERPVILIGTVVATFGLAVSAFSTEVYHLYISYGLITGIGLSMALNPSVSILDVYFDRKKRLANGLALTGLGFGSCIIPPILSLLEETYGWRGAILIMGGITAQVAILSSFLRPVDKVSSTMKASEVGEVFLNGKASMPDGSRIKPIVVGTMEPDEEIIKEDGNIDVKVYLRQNYIIQTGEETQSLTFDEKGRNHQEVAPSMCNMFTSVPYTSLIILQIVLNFSISIVYTHFGNYALTIGISKEHVVLLYTSMGIASSITRPLSGMVAHVTRANTALFIVITFMLLGVLTVLMTFTHELLYMYCYAIAFQSLMSPYNVLCPTIVMESVPKVFVPVAYGISTATCVPGTLLGPPLAALLYSSTNVYAYSFYVAGGLYILSALMMIPAAIFLHKNSKVILSKTSE